MLHVHLLPVSAYMLNWKLNALALNSPQICKVCI